MPNANWLQLQENLGGIFNSFAEEQKRKKEQQEALNFILQKAMIEQQAKQQDPLYKLLQYGQVADALQKMGLNIQDLEQNLGMEQPIQPSPIQPLGQQLTQLPLIRQPIDLEPTEFKPTPFGGVQPTKYEKIGAKAEEEITKKSAQQSAKLTEDYLKARQNIGRLEGAFAELISQGKLMAQEQGGLGIGPGLRGKLGRLGARITGETEPTKAFSGISGFEGQLQEVALSLSPILTGQNRIIRGIVAMIKKTLPTTSATGPEFTRQLQQSLRNAYRIQLAVQKNIVSPEEIKKLNNQNEGVIQNRLTALANQVTLTPEEENIFQEMWNNVMSTPAAVPENLFLNQQNITTQVNSQSQPAKNRKEYLKNKYGISF